MTLLEKLSKAVQRRRDRKADTTTTKKRTVNRKSRWYILHRNECRPHLFLDGKCLYCGHSDQRGLKKSTTKAIGEYI